MRYLLTGNVLSPSKEIGQAFTDYQTQQAAWSLANPTTVTHEDNEEEGEEAHEEAAHEEEEEDDEE